MIVIVILLILLQVLCIGFAFKCLKLTKCKDMNYLSKFLLKFVKILLGVIIIAFAFSVIILVVTYYDSILLLVVIIQSIIDLYFIIMIGNYGIKFINNLNKDLIYVKDNATYLLEISRTFIYYSIVNGIAGVVVAIITNIISSPHFDYNILISTEFFMFLLFGIVFYVIHLLFERSIEIYEENELTI